MDAPPSAAGAAGAWPDAGPIFPEDPPRSGHPSTWLPFPYQRVPGTVRLALSRWLMGSRAVPAHPPADAFHRDDPTSATPSPWPAGARAVLALSHDIDTHRGVAQVAPLLDMEESLGVRSTLFLPGEIAACRADAVRGWQARGFEIALHDVRHDNRLASLAEPDLERRLSEIARAATTFGMRGFRAPSLWMRAAIAARLPAPLAYDSSFVSFRPTPRFTADRGLGTCHPFRVGQLWELPVSLPLDDDLLRAGVPREGRARALAGWVAAIAARGGVALHVDHVEPHLSGNHAGRAAHRDWVTSVQRDPTIWIAPLGDVVSHLQARTRSPAKKTFQSRT